MIHPPALLVALAILAMSAAATLAAPDAAPAVAPPPAAGHQPVKPAADHAAGRPGARHDERTPAVRRGEERHPAPAHRPEGRAAAPARHASAGEARPRSSGCVSQRGMIAVVQAGHAVPLSAIRAEAERRGNGELINAALCRRGGRLTYLVSVLGENGRVAHLSFDAQSGRLVAAGH